MALYAPEHSARVTNLSGDRKLSATLAVNGTFSNAQGDLIILLSRAAGEDLGMVPGRTYFVRITPVRDR